MKVIKHIKFYRSIRITGFLSVFLFIVLSGLTIIPLVYHADTTEAAPGTATESTITLDVTNNTASVDLTVNSTNGTFATSTTNNEASFSVTTNNYTGYTLSISAADDTGTLDNGEHNLSSITSNLTESEFNTTTNNGKWGYKPSKYYVSNEVVDNTGEGSVFLSSPTTEATTLDVTNTANNEANSYTIGLGARADYSSSAGTYTKTFTLTVVGNPINYSITYNANAGTDTVTNMPYESTNNIQAGDTSATTITLSNLVPVREHYSFLGWCSGTVTTTNGVDSCSTGAVIYNPNGDGTNLVYGIDQTVLNDATIYAMWKPDTFTCTKQYRLQNADGTYPATYTADGSETINYGGTCTYSKSITDYQMESRTITITQDQVISLDLQRNRYELTVDMNSTYIESIEVDESIYGDNTFRWGQSVYISANASDGNEFTSWSQTSGTAGTFGSTTSASTTFTMGKGDATIYADGKETKIYMQNLASSQCTATAQKVYDNRDEEPYLIQRLADGKCWMLDNLRLSSTSVTMNSSNTNIASGRTWKFPNASGSWSSSYTAAYINASSKNTVVTGWGSGSKKVGTYYNYCAATAGTYCPNSSSGSGNANYDICPAGWRMPTGGNSGELKTLFGSYSNNVSNFRTALSLALTGDYSASGVANQNVYGSWWTQTIESKETMYFMYIDSSNIYSTANDYRYAGNGLRCVQK